jgi:hypothetical protein
VFLKLDLDYAKIGLASFPIVSPDTMENLASWFGGSAWLTYPS